MAPMPGTASLEPGLEGVTCEEVGLAGFSVSWVSLSLALVWVACELVLLLAEELATGFLTGMVVC